MGEKATDTIEIDASVERIREVILDLETYPEWADGVTSIEVTDRDEQGRPRDAVFHVDARVFQTTYTLRYDLSDTQAITWKLIDGRDLRQLDGSYTFEKTDRGVRVIYSLEVDVALPLPGFLKKRGAKHILDQGLRGLQARVEQA